MEILKRSLNGLADTIESFTDSEWQSHVLFGRNSANLGCDSRNVRRLIVEETFGSLLGAFEQRPLKIFTRQSLYVYVVAGADSRSKLRSASLPDRFDERIQTDPNAPACLINATNSAKLRTIPRHYECGAVYCGKR